MYFHMLEAVQYESATKVCNRQLRAAGAAFHRPWRINLIFQRCFLKVAAVIVMAKLSMVALGKKREMGLSGKGRDK